MSVVVLNFNLADDVRLCDPLTGTTRGFVGRTWKDADGRFCEQDGSFICLFKSHGRIHLFLDGVTSLVDDVKMFSCGYTTSCAHTNGNKFSWRMLVSDDTAAKNSDEQKNAPELPIGRFLKSKSLGGNRVILVVRRLKMIATQNRGLCG